MKSMKLVKNLSICLFVCGVWLSLALPLAAQETSKPVEGSGSHMGMHGKMEHGHGADMMAAMQKHHEEMEKMHEAANQELKKQMSALRERTKSMDGITDEKQLLGELKKHQLMSDTLLGTMLEQEEKMHAAMKEHHKQMHEHRHGHMKEGQPSQ
jgi:TolA-binding protein